MTYWIRLTDKGEILFDIMAENNTLPFETAWAAAGQAALLIQRDGSESGRLTLRVDKVPLIR